MRGLFLKRRIFDLFRRQSTQTNTNLPRLEQIWFPYYLLEYALQYPDKTGTMTITVEAWSGAFALFDDTDGGVMHGQPDDEHDLFPPSLTLEEAEKFGRDGLVRAILHQRRRRVRPTPGDVLRAELLYYPLWVWYFERRPGFIDIKVRDAHNGKSVGGRTRRGIMDAFAAKARGE